MIWSFRIVVGGYSLRVDHPERTRSRTNKHSPLSEWLLKLTTNQFPFYMQHCNARIRLVNCGRYSKLYATVLKQDNRSLLRWYFLLSRETSNIWLQIVNRDTRGQKQLSVHIFQFSEAHSTQPVQHRTV